MTGVFTGQPQPLACNSGGLAAPRFNDCIEAFVGTDPLDNCANTPGANDEPVDSMPADLNDDQKVSGADRTLMVLAIKAFNASPSVYNKRYDLNADNSISGADRTIVVLYIKATGGLLCA